jgi:putative ABC transport system substrate-binding protein
VIVASGNDASLAAKTATTTLPIVFSVGGDPVALGLVTNLKRPGGNVTGSTVLSAELAPKRLQLLHDLLPNAARFGVLADPAAATGRYIAADLQAAARALGLQLIYAYARTDSDFETAFATFSQQHVAAVLIGANTSFYSQRTKQLAALAARHSLPAMFPYREYALAGGLMSYGSTFDYFNRQAGVYAGRILKGEKPADLPVEQATRIELTLNLKTAKALGIEFPTGLLVRADEVIE